VDPQAAQLMDQIRLALEIGTPPEELARYVFDFVGRTVFIFFLTRNMMLW
jgi:hypothetical protein